MSSGGSCRSAVISTAASPVAYARPAVRPPSIRKLRASWSILNRSSPSWISISFSQVSSTEPFSTMMTSKS